MAEFASKGVAGAGLGLGIAGTALGLMAGGLNGITGNCGAGFFQNRNCCSGLNQTYVDSLQARIAELTAEKYSNQVGADAYKAAVAMAEKLDDKWSAQLGEVTREVADSRVREARMEEQIKCIQRENELQHEILGGKINEVALVANNGLTALAGTVACLQKTVEGITKTIVPDKAICPQPMPLYNDWKAPTSSTASSPATN